MSETKTEVIRLRVTAEQKAQFQKAAESKNRTLSNYILTVLLKDTQK